MLERSWLMRSALRFRLALIKALTNGFGDVRQMANSPSVQLMRLWSIVRPLGRRLIGIWSGNGQVRRETLPGVLAKLGGLY
ncbi:hypothetical protein LINPERHAP1_LOCUS1680 [Linum perenne]